MTNRAKQPSIPFRFALDYLTVEYALRPMFGCFAVYVRDRLCLVLRKRPDHPSMNGVWIATRREHHASLAGDIPTFRSIPLLGKAPTNWQLIPERSAAFETSVLRACELVSRGDPRIGTTAARRRPKRRASPRA